MGEGETSQSKYRGSLQSTKYTGAWYEVRSTEVMVRTQEADQSRLGDNLPGRGRG